MSFHKTPKYQVPALIDALQVHGLEHDTPSQAADFFRCGWMAAEADKQGEITQPQDLHDSADKALARQEAEIAALRQMVSENDLMAECTVMLRDDLIEAGIVDKTVPPMMLTEAILRYASALRKDAERYRWLQNPENSIDYVCTKITGRSEGLPGAGVLPSFDYEWRAGKELDAAIDAAIAQAVQPERTAS